MSHHRDASVLLVLLCFGVGCMVLKLHSGEVGKGIIIDEFWVPRSNKLDAEAWLLMNSRDELDHIHPFVLGSPPPPPPPPSSCG